MPGYAVTHAGLRPGRGHHDRFAEVRRGIPQGLEPGGVNAIVVGEQNLHTN
jgi:hypothetical protein